MSDERSVANISQLVRRQLRDLHIDPDATADGPQPRSAGHLKAWCSDHAELLLIACVAAGMVALTGGIVLLCSVLLTDQTSSGVSPRAQSVSVQLGDTSVQLGPPLYHALSPGESILMLPIRVRNSTANPLLLYAGNLRLADKNGAVFPLTWRDTSGLPVDGFSEPDHPLLSLSPGAETTMQLSFLLLSNGPFDLRYQPVATQTDDELPSIALAPT